MLLMKNNFYVSKGVFNQDIYRRDGLKLSGSYYHRRAARGVLINDSRILLVYSEVNGDYKFPGGGIDEKESNEDAVKREVLEECGVKVTSVISLLGRITEYDRSKDNGLDYFKMDSYYYLCEAESLEFLPLNLDKYEEELKFTPVWVELNKAIEKNSELIKSNNAPVWTKRENIFLSYLSECLSNEC